jgi:hypothetical protein
LQIHAGNWATSKDLWLARFPDIVPDFFLWGLLKRLVYTNKPQTIDDLKAPDHTSPGDCSHACGHVACIHQFGTLHPVKHEH